MWLRYVQAVGLGLSRREVPLIHIVFSPCVPLIKYVVPVVGIWAVYFACGLDSMHIRMIADEDAHNRAQASEAASQAAQSKLSKYDQS